MTMASSLKSYRSLIMSLDISYKSEKDFLKISVKGQLLPEEFQMAMEKITQSDQYPPNTNTIWDMRDLDSKTVDPNLLENFIKIRKQYPVRDTARQAFVANEDLAFGSMRMYEIVSSLDKSDLPENIMVFRSYSEAEIWLLSE